MSNKKFNLDALKSISGGFKLEGEQKQEAERIYQGLKNGELDEDTIWQLCNEFLRARNSVRSDPSLSEQEKREKYIKMRDQARIYGAAISAYRGLPSHF